MPRREAGPGSDHHGAGWRVRHAKGTLVAWSWLPLSPPGKIGVIKGRAVILQFKRDHVEHLLVSFETDDLTPLGELLPETACAIPGVVAQTTQLVEGIKNPALRRFVTDALLQPIARTTYWRIPASRLYHHAGTGGLAQHCLGIATMVATASGLTDEDRDLGIAFALVHDYGKLDCTPQRADAMSHSHHEKVGLQLLAPLLERLIREDRDAGLKMRELPGGDRVPRTSPYPNSIGRVVRAFDQLSCEANKRSNDFEF